MFTETFDFNDVLVIEKKSTLTMKNKELFSFTSC